MINLLRVVAVAAVALTSCQNNFEEVTNEVVKGNVVVNFVAESTRTSVDTTGDAPIFSWSENETFAVLEQTDALAKATNVIYENVDGKASIKAELAANPDKGTYQYVVVYPETGFVSAESVSSAVLALPAEQTMAEESYDPTADLMVSKPVETTAQPTEAQYVQFTRLAAVAKMTIKNLTLADGESVEKVEFTANGKTLAGRVTTDLTNPETLAVNQGVSTVSVATTSADVVYFTVLPTTLEAGDSYSVVILTNKHLYVKSGTIPAEKSLAFEAGVVTRFNVNMEGVAPSEKWTLVRDASTLNAGDIVTIAASDLNYALGCYFSSNFPYASYTEVVKIGDYLYHPIITDKSKYQYMIQPLILSEQGNAFDLYNGVDYEGDAKSGYLTNLVTNNYLKLSDYPTINTRLYITVDNETGVATVVASDSEFNPKALKYRAYNNGTSTSNRRFGFVSDASSDEYHDVCIYKLEGKTSEVPVAGAVVTVPGEDEKVVIPLEGVAEDTVLEDVKFTYVGDWTIAVSTDAQWLTLEYADGVLRYSAEANDGAVRYATVTISATHEGEEAKSWTVNVVQKGVPVKVTVAEFIEKDVDPNVEYEVTGILKKKATDFSYSTTIADIEGNEATFKYIDMENGDAFYTNESIELGDIVTIVAAVSASKTGGSTSAHAICKGYYNISATAESDLVAYTGGSVTLNLSKKGTLNPGDITCTVNEDFAEVEYTTNADEATVTLAANEGAPRQVIATFTDGIATASVAIVQSADTTKGNTWALVTDASTLEVGDQVIIAAKDYDVALSTTISSDRRSAVNITKLGNYYLTPAATAQTLILANGSVDGTFAFYDADNEGFLVSSSTSYYLENQAYIDENTSFAISIADGVATIGNKTGNYKDNKINYREGSSYNYFYSGTSTKQPVCLYRLVGVKGTVPVIPADITVPSASNKVVVPEEGTAVATPIDEVVFNYVGEWNIEATSVAEWINFEFDKANNRLTYTAQANESVVRETTATITATMDGQEPLTWSFNILQKGKPQEITIAEFATKGQDVNTTYKLTGIVTEIPSSATGKWKLADENGTTVQIQNLETESGEDVKGNIDIKEGDVITLTTVVATTTKGLGGNSSYPSTYKGYYRLTATASTKLVGYEGDTVTFDLATEGNLLPAETVISGAMAEAYDFVTFNHTAGATTATATFAANAGAPRNAEFNFTYGLATASVAIGQQNNPSVKVGWFLVTDVTELDFGDKVIIAAKSPDETLDYAISSKSSNTTYRPAIAITLLGNSISNVEGVQQYTLESGHTDCPNTWAFKGDSDSKYLYYNSGLKVTSTLNKEGSWDIAIAEDGKATLTSQTTNSKNTMMLNYVATNQTFSMYVPTEIGKGAIYLYKEYK